MADIETNKNITLENLLSLRKKMLSTEINEEMIKISKLFAANGIKKAGPIVTTTFAVLENNVLDMEILVPMDKIFELPNEYKFKPKFKLTNAIYARHCGNPAFLQEVCNEMVEFISRNGLQQITPGYNVTVKDLLPCMSVDDCIIDVYIGVSDNIL